MPIFGDYETVGEPVATTEESGRVSTIWQAKNRDGRDNRLYAIKCFDPHGGHRQPDTSFTDGPLEIDRRLEFLDTVKQLKKARSEGGRGLAPLYAFGTADEGAWYATDFHRRTLKTWIALRGVVDDAALRHVVHSLAVACLAMQKSCGRSHGNIKLGNVFLSGKPRALRKMPLEVIDPRLASLIQAARPGQGRSRVEGEELSRITETQDLHAIGLVILQLVEGRVIRGEHDYNYPVDHSSAWDKLGRQSEHWRQLCNQLLNPHLSPDAVTLESLATQYRPNELMAKAPMALGVLGAVVVVGLGIYFAIPGTEKKFQSRYQAAQAAFDAKNYPLAREEIEKALKYKPDDSSATALKIKIETIETEIQANALEREQKFKAAISAAQTAFDQRDYPTAIGQADAALQIKPNDPDATRLKSDAEKKLLDSKTAAERENNYKTAIAAAQAAYNRRDYSTAETKADAALAIKSNDPTALALKANAQKGEREHATAAENERKYNSATSAAQTALDQNDFAGAVKNADTALGVKPGDAYATDLKNKAVNGQREQERDRDYRTAISAAQAALDRKDYATTESKADAALAIRPNDLTATTLKASAQARIRELAEKTEQDRNYNAAISAAQAAYNRQEYSTAETQADAALAIRHNDSTATKLKSDAQARLHELAEKTEQDRNYNAAISAAQTAYNRQEYSTAETQADAALAIRNNDPTATKLKSDAQAREKEIAERATIERRYKDAMSAGQVALDQNDFGAAAKQADAALAVKPGDANATDLKNKAVNGQREQERDRTYRAAISAAQTAFDGKDYATTRTKADAALAIRPNDATATKLKSDAQARERENAEKEEQDRNYKAAMAAAKAAFDQKDFAEAAKQAEAALAIKPGDAYANDFKTKSDGRQRELVNERNYNVAIGAAQKAFDGKDYRTTVSQADVALAIRSNDATATKLKGDALDREREIALKEEQERNYNAAIAAAQTELDRQDYTKAVAQADAALAIRPSDAQAINLKRGAQVRAQLDARFEVLLVAFNQLASRKAKYPEAKGTSLLPSGLSFEDKKYYQDTVDNLQKLYNNGGWLDKPSGKISKANSYKQDLQSLKGIIENW